MGLQKPETRWGCTKDYQNELQETAHMTAPITSNTLGVNVFTAPGKAMVGERPKPFGETLGFDPITSTLIFGEYDAVLVDAMTTVAEAEARPFRPLLRSERSARPFPERSGDSNAQDGERHADVFHSPSGAVSPPVVSWASGH
jgi:hypothetical protein